MSFIPWYITFIRLVVPVAILRWPLWGILASIWADVIDWDLIGIRSKEMDEVYQRWDKGLDTYYQIFILWIVLKWKDRWARNMALGLFVYRIIGTVLFYSTSWRPILFFFPNIFDNFVVVCLIIFWWTKKQKLYLDRVQKTVMMAVLIIPKMFQEYFQHFLDKQPWEIYKLGKMMGISRSSMVNLNSILWIIILYVIPVLGFLVYLRMTDEKGFRKGS